jgi:protein MpaA
VRAALAVGLALAAAAAAPAPARHGESFGRSVDGRTLRAVRIGPADAATRVLVVGCVHGNECAGTAVTRRLRAGPLPAGVAVWVIDDLNPDGRARGVRQNARGVDLNRNFPRGWRAQGSPGSTYYSGPRALSEPESRAVARLIVRLRPAVTVWYHQHMRIVVRTGGDVGLQRRYARLVGLPLRRLPNYPGTAVRWQNHRFPGTTAFVVELPAGPLSAAGARRHARAVLDLARRVATAAGTSRAAPPARGARSRTPRGSWS